MRVILKDKFNLVFVLLVFYIGISFANVYGREEKSGSDSSAPESEALRFKSTETKGEYKFDTGIIRGTLRSEGKSRGLSEVIYLPKKIQIDGSLGLFGFYRIFAGHRRFGAALWGRASAAQLLPEGAVKVVWPAEKECPFELTAIYRLLNAASVDLEIMVKPSGDLPTFEVFLASYFHEDFPSSYIYVQKEVSQDASGAEFVEAGTWGGKWQMYPRDKQVIAMIKDGRWQQEPHPVDWDIRECLAAPVGMRRHAKSGLSVVLMARPEDCFAIATPYTKETHYSQYLSLFGRNLYKDKTIHAHTRLLFTWELSDAGILQEYQKFILETKDECDFALSPVGYSDIIVRKGLGKAIVDF